MLIQKQKVSGAAHDLMQLMIGDPLLRMSQTHLLKKTPQWSKAERALRDAIDRVIDKQEEDEEVDFWVRDRD